MQGIKGSEKKWVPEAGLTVVKKKQSTKLRSPIVNDGGCVHTYKRVSSMFSQKRRVTRGRGRRRQERIQDEKVPVGFVP